MPSARSTRQVGWPRPCNGFSKTASPRRRRCVRVLAAPLTCMRRDRRRHARGCGGLQRPFFFLSCGSAICARCIVTARTARLPYCVPARQHISTRACLVDGRALRAPETRSGRCLFLALSIRSYRESINAVMGCEYTARFVTWTRNFESCMRALPTVRAALTAAPGASSPPSPWRPFVLKLMCLALLHLSFFVLLRA